MSKWVNKKAFKKYQEKDKIIEIPELTDAGHTEIDRLEKKREKAQESSKKGWKTRRRNAFLKAMTKAEQGVIIDGKLVKGFVVDGINIAKAGLDYIDVFNTTYHLNNPSHNAKKINVEFFLSDYLKIKKAKGKKPKAKNRTEENRRHYLKHKEAIRAKQKIYREKNKDKLKEKRLGKKLEKAVYDYNKRNGTTFTLDEYKIMKNRNR